MGLFKKWRVEAYTVVSGHYSIAIDTISGLYEIYEEEDEGFWGEQYEYQDAAVYDSLRLTIRRNSIFYDNELFDCVFTIKVKPKYHYYELVAENDRDRMIYVGMYPTGNGDWKITVSDSEKDGWGGIWVKRELD